AGGAVKLALNEADVRKACELFRREKVDAVAISFLWAAVNPAHERRAAEIVRQMMPEVFVSVGSDVFPQIREYTRTSTAVVNAYLGPILESYVGMVDRFFADLGAARPVRYFQSNGGLALGAEISAKSVYAINSGPASAPQAGLFLADSAAGGNVI